MTRALSEITAVTPVGESEYTTVFGEEAGIPGGLVNGGVVLGAAARALVHATGRPHPVTITGHFLDGTRPDVPVTIRTEVVRPGRHTFARAMVHDADDRALLAVTGTFADLDAAEGVTRQLEEPAPPPDEATLVPWPPQDREPLIPPPPIASVFDMRVVLEDYGWAFGEPSGRASMDALVRPRVGPWDPLDLVVLADGFPPPVFNLDLFGWAPTLELTVQLRGLPRDDEALTCRAWTTELTNGYLDEDVTVRGEDGRILVLARQLGMVPKAPA